MAEFIAGRGTQALSIIGTVLGGLATLGEGMGVLNGSNSGNGGVAYATKDDVANAVLLASKDSEISLLRSEQNANTKIIETYKELASKINSNQAEQNAWNTAQMVNNTTMSSAIAVCQNSISALQGMTKLVIPNSSVCPGWGTTSSGSGSGTGTT